MKIRLHPRTCYDLIVDEHVKATFCESSSWEGLTALERQGEPGKLIVAGMTGAAHSFGQALGRPAEVEIVSASPDLVELVKQAAAREQIRRCGGTSTEPPKPSDTAP